MSSKDQPVLASAVPGDHGTPIASQRTLGNLDDAVKYVMHKHGLTGAVLAGGLGRRLGGVDKGFLPVAGRPMIERVLACLVPQVDKILINANRHKTEYARYG